jgi:hypothetical protein
MVIHIDSATHLVAKSITATVKTLYAIICHQQIVSMDWIRQFESSLLSEESGSIVDYPEEALYFPSLGKKVIVEDVSKARNHLFERLHVIFLIKQDVSHQFICSYCVSMSIVNLTE